MGRFEEPGGQKLFGPKEVPYPYRRPKAPSAPIADLRRLHRSLTHKEY